MAAGCKPSHAHARGTGREGRSRLRFAAMLGVGASTLVGLAYASPARAGVPPPPNIFNAPLQLIGALGANDPSISLDAAGTTYVAAADGAGRGCVLDTFSHDGSKGHYLGRPQGGTGCAIAVTPAASGSPDALAYAADGPGGLIVGRSTTAGANFGSALLPTSLSAGAQPIAVDPQLPAGGQPTTFLISRDATSGLPQLASSVDGGLTYVAGASPINPLDISATKLQGAPPVAGNLVARRDDTGLKLYTVILTASSGTDHSLDRVWEAVGAVTPPGVGNTQPAVAWHDVLAYSAPVGSQLNRPAPVTTVDAGGHVYVAFADGAHVYVKSDVDGTHWTATASPVAVDTASAIPGGLTSSLLPALAAGGSGIVDLAWYGASGGTGTSDAHDTWDVYLAQSTDSGASWTPFSVTSHAIHQGALCVAGDAACAAAQQSPPDHNIQPALQLAVNQVTGAAVLAYDDDSALPGLPLLEATRQCSGISAASGQPLVNDCAAPQQPSAAPAASTCPGPQLTDLPSDAIDDTASGSGQNIPNLDLTQEVLNRQLNGNLQTAMSVQFLSVNPGVPNLTAQTWTFHWAYNSVNYYAQATVSAAPPVFVVGTVNPDGSLAPGHTVTGGFTSGSGAQVLINIPAADVGGPPLGATLGKEWAASYATFSSGAPSTGPILVDRMPDAGYGANATLVQCAPQTDVPDAPVAVMLPVGAGLTGAILLWLRRKRSRSSVKEGDEGGIPRHPEQPGQCEDF
jgi:hypothetical protein